MKGLRERKKEAARQAISERAMELFATHGFDNVTVADVAAAADVAVQTVFNYFPAKEDLVLASRAEIERGLIDKVRRRAPGSPVIDAVRAHTLDLVRYLESMPAARRRQFRKIMQESPSIRSRLRLLSIKTEQELAAAIHGDNDGKPDPVAQLVAATFLMLANLPYSLDPEKPASGSAELVRQIEEVFATFSAGLARYAPGTKSQRHVDER